MFTSTRVWVALPISPASSETVMAKVIFFPSTAVTSARARTSRPTGVALICSRFSAVPTLVCPWGRACSIASQAAPSIRAAMQGVA